MFKSMDPITKTVIKVCAVNLALILLSIVTVKAIEKAEHQPFKVVNQDLRHVNHVV